MKKYKIINNLYMKVIQYVYFDLPGEKQKIEEIAKNSINKIDMAGRIIASYPNINIEDASIIANKFFKK